MSMTVRVKTKISNQKLFIEAIKRRIEDGNVHVDGDTVSFRLPDSVGDKHLPYYGRRASMNFKTGELACDEDYSKDILPFVSQMYRAEQVINAAETQGLIYEETMNDKGEIVLEVEHA